MKELEDYTWFPAKLRTMQMEYIGFIAYFFRLYKPLVGIVQTMKKNNVVDVCSGSGWPAYYMHLNAAIQQTHLTDVFVQNPPFKNNTIFYLQQPANVFTIEVKQAQLITMYNAFHHFNKQQQHQLIQQWAKQGNSFVIVEILQPTIVCYIQVLLASTIGVLLFSAFIKPLSFTRLLFTYLIPINIITILWDGMISVFKSKSINYFQQLISTVTTDNYSISVQQVNQVVGNLLIIKGEQL